MSGRHAQPLAGAMAGSAAPAARPDDRVLVLCLGNELRADDGVGWLVADELAGRQLPAACRVRKSAVSGLYLLDEMDGWERVIVVDAMLTGRRPPGAVHSFPVRGLRTEGGPSPHAIGLPSALATAASWGVPTPAEIQVVAVEVCDLSTMGGALTPAVRAAIPVAADQVLGLLGAQGGARS